MSDLQRVLTQLERGPVSPIQFQAPNVCDGQKPILRVAARIRELREQGYTIRSSRARNGTAVYVMDDVPVMDDGLENGDAAPAGTPEMASPSVAPAVEQAPAAASEHAAVASPPSRDHAGGLLDSPLFDGNEFTETLPHWLAA